MSTTLAQEVQTLLALSLKVAQRANDVRSYVPRDLANAFDLQVAKVHALPGGRNALLTVEDWHLGPIFDSAYDLDCTLESARTLEAA